MFIYPVVSTMRLLLYRVIIASLRLSTVTKIDNFITEREWMSYKQITDLDGIPLFKAKLAQGTLDTQAVQGLDPEHEATKALPEAERLQYRRATVKEAEGVSKTESAARGSKEEPGDTEDPAEDEKLKNASPKSKR